MIDKDDMGLNEEQRSVVEHVGGPALVIAGAGTGKTTTLIHRVGRLVEMGVDPSRILLLTFSNRSAMEMKRRAEELVPGGMGLWNGTFHSVGNRLLRENAELVGLRSDYVILGGKQGVELLQEAIGQEGLKMSPSEQRQLYSAYHLKENRAWGVWNVRLPCEEEVGEGIFERYRELKRLRNGVDFADLLVGWRRMLEEGHPLRERLQGRFDTVLVDEFQDTTPLQGEIVYGMAKGHGNVMVVGDDRQSIYGFRGATPEVFWLFEEQFAGHEEGVKRYFLYRNYRSTEGIVRLARASIERNRTDIARPFEAEEGMGRGGPLPYVVDVKGGWVGVDFVIYQLKRLLVEEGVGLEEMAILYRNHDHGNLMEEGLRRVGCPYRRRGRGPLAETPLMRELMPTLMVLQDPRDGGRYEAYFRQFKGIGEVRAGVISEVLGRSEDPIGMLLVGGEGSPLEEQPEDVRNTLREGGLYLSNWLELVGGGGADRGGDLVGLLDRISREHVGIDWGMFGEGIEYVKGIAKGYGSLGKFLDAVTLMGGRSMGEGGGTGVTLATVHQAKGLEWEAVFVLSLVDEQFPSYYGLRSDSELEEERRLFHVAVTRAKRWLYLMVGRQEEERGERRGVRRGVESLFLRELTEEEGIWTRLVVSHQE